MEGGRGAGLTSDGDKKESTWGRTSRYTDKHGQPGINILESGTMEGGRGAGLTSDGDKKESTWGRTPIHTDKHGQPGINILESGTMEGGRGAGGSSDGDKFERLGAEHPDTLTSMANLASTYRNQGRWKEAE